MGAPGAPGGNIERAGYQLVVLGRAAYEAATARVAAVNATLRTSLQGIQAQSVATAGSTAALGGALSTFRRDANNLTKDLSKAAFFLGRFQFVIISTVAALAGLGAPLIFAGRFEEQISRIAGLTNIPRESIAQLREEILALSRDVAISPEELGAGAYFILSSGIDDATQALEVLRVASLSSVAGLGETSDITRTLTAIMNAYSLATEDAQTITDQLVQTVREGAAEPADLANSLGRVIPIASQMGVEFAQVGAVLAQMTNIGLSTERSVTGLIGIFNALLRPSERSRELFKALGFEIETFRQEVDQNFVGAMLRLFDAIQGNEAIVAELFPDLRGLIGVLASFGRGREVEDILNNITDSALALDSAVEEAQNTLAFKFRKALNDVRLALTRLGQTLTPTASRLFENISRFVERATVAARNFRDEWGPTLREFGRDLADIIRQSIAFGVALARALRQAGALAVLRALGEVVKFLARNFDILGPAVITFAVTALAAVLIPKIIAATAAMAAFIRGLIAGRIALNLLAAAASGSALAFGAIFGALALGGAILFTLTRNLFSVRDAADKAEDSFARLVARNRELVARFIPQGLSQQSAELAALSIAYGDVKSHIDLVRDAQRELTSDVAESETSYKNLLEAALSAPAGSEFQRNLAEQARIGKERFELLTSQLESSNESANIFLGDLEKIKREFKEVEDTGIVAATELAIELDKVGVPAEDIRQLLPSVADEFDRITDEANRLGDVAPKTFDDLLDKILPAEDALRRSADLVNDLTEAFGGLGRELDKVLGIETKDTIELDRQIALRRAAVAQIEAQALATGGFTDEQERIIGVLEDDIDLFNAQKDAILETNKAYALGIRLSDDFNPTLDQQRALLIEVALGSDAATFGIAALADIEEEARRKGIPFADTLSDIIELAREEIKFSIKTTEIDKAKEKVDELNLAWAQLARGAVEPITLRVNFQSTIASAKELVSNFLGGVFSNIGKAIEETAGRTPIGDGAAEREVNPFERFVQQEQIREIIRRAAETGRIAWSDVARLWELGAKDAANQFARFLRGEIQLIGDEVGEFFRDIARGWLDEVEIGILEGTVDVLDALHFLERGMIDAAQRIVEGLSGQADRMAEQWQILIDVLNAGLVTIQDVNRLFDIGATEAALDFLRFLAGDPSLIGEAIPRFQRQQTRGLFRGTSLQEGGFIPPGPPVPALLHGPEVVLPLGNMNALNALQRALVGFGGVSGGFRNYGSIQLNADSDSGREVVRSLSRALGV